MKFPIRKVIGILLTLSVLAGAIAIASPAGAQGTDSMSLLLAGGGTSVANSATFTVNLNIANQDVSRGWQAIIQYDSTKLTFNRSATVWSGSGGSTDYINYVNTGTVGNEADNTTFSKTNNTTVPTAAIISGIGEALAGGTAGTGVTDAAGSTYVTLSFTAITNDTHANIHLVTTGGLVSKINNAGSGAGLLPYTITTNDLSLTIGSGGPLEQVTANPVSTSAVENSTGNVITLNASDSYGNPITYSLPSNTTAQGGALTALDPVAGTVNYAPKTYFNGSDSFTYTATANGFTNSNTVTIAVSWVNQPPVANAQSVSVGENGQTPTNLPITLTSSDPDNTNATIHTQTPTYAIGASPINGKLSGLNTSTGAVTYTPNQYYVGSDSFTFTVTDNGASQGQTNLTSTPATVNITVGAVPQAPVANNQTVLVTLGTPQTITLSATDQDKDALTYSIVAQPSSGTGTLGAVSGSTVVFTPVAAGITYFTFKAHDTTENLDSNIATVTLNVQSGAIQVDGTRQATITFTSPSGNIQWAFNPLSTGSYTDNSHWMTVLSDTGWTVYVGALPGALNGHMTKYNPVTGTYDDSVSLYDPLQISATGTVVTGSAAGPNGQLVSLGDTNQVLASASMTDINTAGSYLMGYDLSISQKLEYVDPGLPLGYTYHTVAQFTSQVNY